MSVVEKFPTQIADALAKPSLFGLVAGAAAAGALGGVVAGVGVLLYRGIMVARSPNRPEGAELAADSLAEVATDAVVGAGTAALAALSGAGLAALFGRNVLSLALPGVVGALAAAAAREPAFRVSRRVADDVVRVRPPQLSSPPSPDRDVTT
jgi:hypothetical protein